jgi:hypothetical protein
MIRTSTMMVPIIHPGTAQRTARSFLAEKNFWYMLASPSSRNMVGRNRRSAVTGDNVPKIDN